MQDVELKNLILEIRKHKTEKQNLELKSAQAGCPSKLFGTLSAFSNQDTGGIILFGIDENRDYEVVGVYDV